MIETLSDYFPLLVEKFYQHLFLAGFSTLSAIALGIPFGILAAKSRRLKTVILGTANIMQTIPSLALLAFLIPFLGIGSTPALVTLAVYAVLPIVRNTQTGIESVSQEVLEAADGIGFRPLQKLIYVELPLAVPFMIAGMRTAAVMGVGIATIAAFIGAGGLGDFIYRGIATSNTLLILLGAVPTALLALALDCAFGRCEKYFSPTSHNKLASKIGMAGVLAAAALIIILGPLAFRSFNPLPQKSVVVATKNFTEQLILGELIAELIEARTEWKVKREWSLGSTDICHAALLRGDIDMYPEYSGTALLQVLKADHKTIAPDEIFSFVADKYRQKFNLEWLPPLGFSNGGTLAIDAAFAARHNIACISDLRQHAKHLKIAAPEEFMSRPDGYATVVEGYQLVFNEIKQMEIGLMYRAIDTKQVDVITGFTTDGRLQSARLKSLSDDQSRFPRYDAAIVVRRAIVENHPEIIDALKPLQGKLSEDAMRQLNYRVEVERISPKRAAREFLLAQQLLPYP